MGSLPVLGGLFRNTTQVMEKRNLVIFIKTSIIDFRSNNGELQDLTDTKYSQIEELLEDPNMRAKAAEIREPTTDIRVEMKRHSKKPNWDFVQEFIA